MDKNKAIKILEELKVRIPSIKEEEPPLRSPKFLKWQLATQTAIKKIFPDNEAHVHRFESINYRTSAYRIATSTTDVAKAAFISGIEKADAILHSMIEEIQIYWSEGGASSVIQTGQHVAHAQNPKIVFVVHGRNESLRKSMFEFLRAMGLQPLEWSQATKATGEATPYVGQILDKAFSMAQAVVVLMTPDDLAYLRKEFQSEHDEAFEKNPTAQARPNVLFEAGMAMGRDVRRTVLVQVGTLRPFSDVGGRHILHLNSTSERRQDLAERLKTAGCDVDLTGRDWHTAGLFELKEAKQFNPAPIESPTTPSPEIAISSPPEVVPGLTVAEAEIIEATPDHGWIYLRRTDAYGQFVSAGKGDFFRETDASHQAKYVDALESLLAKNLVRSEERDAFRLTGRGFEIRKSLKAARSVSTTPSQ
jgi:predicted nucleotide-binding protein